MGVDAVSMVTNLNSKGVRKEIKKKEAGKPNELDFLENFSSTRAVVRHYPTHSVSELRYVVHEIVQRGDEFVVHMSGDGGIAQLVTALSNEIREQHKTDDHEEIARLMPHILQIKGGSADVIADSIGSKKYKPSELIPNFVTEYVVEGRKDIGVYTIPRRSLEVVNGGQAQYGFMFHNGLISNFFREYYDVPEGGNYGFARYLQVFAKGLLAMAGGRYVSSHLREFYEGLMKKEEVIAKVDGQKLPYKGYTGILIGCHGYEIFGMKPFYAAAGNMHVLAGGDVTAMQILSKIPKVLQEKPMGIEGLEDCTPEKMFILPTHPGGEHYYGLDGEIFGPTDTNLIVRPGPLIPFLRYNPIPDRGVRQDPKDQF